MTDRLTDERLEELERLYAHVAAGTAIRATKLALLDALPALIAEVRALRRVAAEAEASIMSAKACCGRWGGERDCTPWTSRGQTCIDCPYENVADTGAALAEWRRVRDLPEREGSG